jgi:hypothetical protein
MMDNIQKRPTVKEVLSATEDEFWREWQLMHPDRTPRYTYTVVFVCTKGLKYSVRVDAKDELEAYMRVSNNDY